MSILVFKSVSKKYSADATAIKEVNLTIDAGEFAALAGPSGSGKTTILNLAAGLDHPTEGIIQFLGRTLKDMPAEKLAYMRRATVGFVFQAYNLFPVLTAMENVEYPLALNDVDVKERKERALAALADVGLADLGKRFPSQLSGGQQQRVAIARAIVANPKIVFADEPTANLDSKTSEKLLQLFRDLNAKKQITFLFSSHDPMVLKCAKRILHVADGTIKKDEKVSSKIWTNDEAALVDGELLAA